MFRRNFLKSLIGLFLSQGVGSYSVKSNEVGYKNIRHLWMYKNAFDQGVIPPEFISQS